MLAECRKCGSAKEIKLKIEGDQAVPTCIECGTPQTHFSKVMINTMRSNKDIMHSSGGEEHVPFGFPCATCRKTMELVYDRATKSAKCGTCGTPAKVNPYMLRGLELTGHVKPASENAGRYDGGEGDVVGTEGKGKIKRQAK